MAPPANLATLLLRLRSQGTLFPRYAACVRFTKRVCPTSRNCARLLDVTRIYDFVCFVVPSVPANCATRNKHETMQVLTFIFKCLHLRSWLRCSLALFARYRHSCSVPQLAGTHTSTWNWLHGISPIDARLSLSLIAAFSISRNC